MAMKTKTAKDIMIPLKEYPHVSLHASLVEVMEVVAHTKIDFMGRQSLPRSVVVYDEDYRLCGMARCRDILRGLRPNFSPTRSSDFQGRIFDVTIDPDLMDLSFESLADGIEVRAKRCVSDVMIPIKETVEFDDNIVKVIHKLVENNLGVMPVMKNKKVVGVVRGVDVLHLVRKLLRKKTKKAGDK